MTIPAEWRHFWTKHGWADANAQLLPADASVRRYVRLHRGSESVLFMAMPPPLDYASFVRLADHLRGLGLKTPCILASCPHSGFAVLEDFGYSTFTCLLNQGADALSLYRRALECLIHLHRQPQALCVDVPAYGRAKLLEEARLLPQWFAQAANCILSPQAISLYDEIWNALLDTTIEHPQTLVLRDFHVDNLMIVSGEGIKSCGLLDFQDAMIGPCVYDVMSLLEDARRTIDPELVIVLQQIYLAAFPLLDPQDFQKVWAIFAAQRHAKVLGLFVRLYVRDGKYHYIHHIPRVWSLLEKACNHEALEPLKAWLDNFLPKDVRGIPLSLRESVND